jgi:hypothetical protein
LLVAVWQVRSDDPNTYSSDGNPHVSIAAAAIAKIEEIRPVLLAMTESQIEADVRDASSGLRLALHLAASGRFEAFYAPLDWVNDESEGHHRGRCAGIAAGDQSARHTSLRPCLR